MTRDELIEAVRHAFKSGALAGTRGITEKRMFGGVAFLLHGNMVAGTASANKMGGALLLRVGKDGEAEALGEPHVRRVEMGGRKIGGYVYVDPAALRTARARERWLQRALAYVRTLPRKKPRAPAKPKRKARTG